MAREPVPREFASRPIPIPRTPDPENPPPPEPPRLAFSMRRLPDVPPHRGRPTDLTDKKANDILVALANGSYRGPAAVLAGVSEETLSRWMARKGEPYETFQAWVKEAEAYAEVNMVHAITSKAVQKPEYAIAFLERKYPERWGRTVATSEQPGIQVTVTNVLQSIEARANVARDPRPPREGVPGVLDVFARRIKREPIPLSNNGDNDEGESDAEENETPPEP